MKAVARGAFLRQCIGPSSICCAKLVDPILQRTNKTCQKRWKSGSSPGDSTKFADPLDKLQPLIQVPLIPPEERVFQPTEDEIRSAEHLFVPTNSHHITIHKGVVDLANLPKINTPEVAFVGQSNVGKSSLIQAIFRKVPQIVKKVSVSKKPGHTKILKHYQIGKHFTLVDMPGYGQNMPSYYVDSMEEYLRTCSSLRQVFLLIDGNEGMQPADYIAIDMMEEFGKPYAAVLTKIDMASHHKLLRNIVTLQKVKSKMMPSCFPQPFLLSAHTYEGIARLQTFISYVTGNLQLKGH